MIIDDIGCVVIEFNQPEPTAQADMNNEDTMPSVPDSSIPKPPSIDSSPPQRVDIVRGSLAGRNPPNVNPNPPRQDPMRGSVARSKE